MRWSSDPCAIPIEKNPIKRIKKLTCAAPILYRRSAQIEKSKANMAGES
jgi:hypothetical protein